MTEAELSSKRDAIQAAYEAFRTECMGQVSALRAEAQALENAVRRRLQRDQEAIVALNQEIARVKAAAAPAPVAEAAAPAAEAPKAQGNGNGRSTKRKM